MQVLLAEALPTIIFLLANRRETVCQYVTWLLGKKTCVTLISHVVTDYETYLHTLAIVHQFSHAERHAYYGLCTAHSPMHQLVPLEEGLTKQPSLAAHTWERFWACCHLHHDRSFSSLACLEDILHMLYMHTKHGRRWKMLSCGRKSFDEPSLLP